MDLNEHTLSETQRTLKRLGVAHVLRSGAIAATPQDQQPSSSPATAMTQAPGPRSGKEQNPAHPETPLPHLLRSLFHGKQIPARTLWTYAGLYRDLQETDNPPRLSVFKKIQESVCLHLKWNPAALCSWPLDIDPGSFIKGVEHLRPQTIILFSGYDQDPDPGIKDNLARLEQAGQRIVVLPNLQLMAQGNQQLKNEAWKILQTIQG